MGLQMAPSYLQEGQLEETFFVQPSVGAASIAVSGSLATSRETG